MGGRCINRQWTGFACENEIQASPGLRVDVEAGRSYRIVAEAGACDDVAVLSCEGSEARLEVTAGHAARGGTILRLDVPDDTSLVELQCGADREGMTFFAQ